MINKVKKVNSKIKKIKINGKVQWIIFTQGKVKKKKLQV